MTFRKRWPSAPKKAGMAKDNLPDGDRDRDMSRRDEVVWGKTPGGTVFRVPTTHDVLTLFNPTYPKSHLDILNLALLGSQLALYAFLPTHIARPFFLAYFVFWRAAYDAGLGWVLTKQSKRKWIVREVQRRAWLDAEKRPKMRAWIKSQLKGKMGKDYSFDELPLEYNAWLLFRQVVDIILLNDFVSYCLFAFACFRIPRGLSLAVHVMRWIAGVSLVAFNLWVKTEAHHVVKDYGWYWGDCFFQRGALVFDGVFEMAPHPMYSVGYAGYYGLSMIVGSYPVLFMSLAAHAAQFAFLVFFENPHIERMYGQKKPIALRTPLIIPPHNTTATANSIAPSIASTPITNSGTSSPVLLQPTKLRSTKPSTLASQNQGKLSTSASSSAELSTPAATEGDSESDSPLETETEDTCTYSTASCPNIPAIATTTSRVLKISETASMLTSTSSSRGSRAASGTGPTRRSRILTQHDLMNIYFRKDMIGFSNIDLLRTSDLKLVLLTIYVLFFTFLFPRIISSRSSNALLLTHFIHALLWRFFHSFGLGLLLLAQSRSKFLVKHFITQYHYPSIDIPESGMHVRQPKQQQQPERDDQSNHSSSEALTSSASLGLAVLARGGEAVKEAFGNWKDLYNLSLCMTYASFVGLAWEAYDAGWLTGGDLSGDWWVGDGLLRHTLGVILIALHIWTARECYEVLGVFGWFFGDFFIEGYPATLEYTGIYRFLNNPERTMCGAAFFGLALISGSKLVFTLAIISQMSHWWFLSRVENPHMQKLYGSSLRREAGLTKVIKKVALKNALLLESRAERHAPELKRVAKEVMGTFDKVYEETAEAMKELLPTPVHAAGAGLVGRVGGLKAKFDLDEVVEGTRELLQQGREKLVISRVTSEAYTLDKTKYRIKAKPVEKFHVGEPIKVEWHAPANHSIRDWIGIYRKGANKSTEVTRISSLGMWMPVHDDEWVGDTPLHLDRSEGAQSREKGEVVFSGDKLPWAPGSYELRYHHNGKHNVLSITEIEIYVEKVIDLTFSNVRSRLMHLVPLALDSDPSLIPLSCQPPEHTTLPQYASKRPLDLKTPLHSDTSSSIPNTPSSPQLPTNVDADADTRDPDDFRFWSEKQAKRLAKTIQMVFDVEYSVEVIVADANLSALTNRILVSKEILH